MSRIKYLAILFLFCLSSVSCTTIATRENGETLKMTGLGAATWPDGAKIEGKPLITFPDIEFDN